MYIRYKDVRINLDLVSFYNTQESEKCIFFFGQRDSNKGGYPVIYTLDFGNQAERDKALSNLDEITNIRELV